MRRINTSTKSANLFGAGKDGFRPGNPGAGLLPTQFSPDWSNDVQETLLHPIEEAGFVAGSDVSLLTQAIAALAGNGGVASISATTALTRAQRGMILGNASAGNVTLTLPPADRILDFIVRRVDNTGNKLIVQGAGTDMIMHNTYINSSGYAFIRLFGSGDYWHLRSDAAGNWWPIARLATDPIGATPAVSTTYIPAGGYTKPNGTIFIRADFPWLWDMANGGANIDTEANWAIDQWGGYSTGDTATTFRVLELRGEFIRVFDDSRGIDAGRGLGSFAADDLKSHHHLYRKDGSGAVALVASGSGSVLYGDDAAITGNTGGSETHPRSVALPALLKII